jgi:hypothetical protein
MARTAGCRRQSGRIAELKTSGQDGSAVDPAEAGGSSWIVRRWRVWGSDPYPA